MNYHTKRKFSRSSMYIVLALIVCSIMSMTVIAFVGAAKKGPRPVEPATPDKLPITENPSQENTPPASTTPVDTPTGSNDEPPYVLPANGYIQKEFSIDLPVWSLTMEDYRAHVGIDVSCPCGSAVYAMTGGVISDITDDPLMGTSLTVIHHDGNISVYRNLSDEFPGGIDIGVPVSAGQIIASVGDTALIEQCESEHLHLEMYSPDGNLINPTTVLDFTKQPPVDSGVE